MGFFSIGGAGSDELILTDGALDFESRSSYEVIVRSTDNGSPNLFHDETLTITVNNETGNISGTIYTDEGVASIGAGANISMVVNGVLTETVTTDGAGSYSFTKKLSPAMPLRSLLITILPIRVLPLPFPMERTWPMFRSMPIT